MKNVLKSGLVLGLLVLGSFSVKADNILYISDNQSHVGYVDLTTDKVTVIGNTKYPLSDIAFTANGNFYGITATALYSLNVSTGAPSLIANFPSSIGAGHLNGLVADGNNLLASSFTTKNIYAIDLSPYSATTLSGKTQYNSAGDLTFGPAGASGPLYDTQSDGLLDKITISGTTITTSVVGSMGNNTIVGLATIGNVTYAVGGTEIYILDLQTAALTPLFNYAGHGLDTASGATVLPSLLNVPEPSNIALLISGIAALAFYQSRKRARA